MNQPHQKIKELVTGLVMLAFVGITAYMFLTKSDNPIDVEKNRQTNARIFCAMGRQWIEFPNGTATWGAAVLDIDGKPVRCDSVRTPNFTKG